MALAVLALLALLPEWPRYVAERQLRAATLLLGSSLGAPEGSPSRDGRVAGALVLADAASAVLGDSRAPIVAGSAHLVARRPQEALARYRQGLARGERAEILLNMGRAWMMLGRRDLAQVALLRAGWTSPRLLASLPEVAAVPLAAEVHRLEAELGAGRLAGPPPMPLE
jgi:hypothetical protein